MSFWRALRKLDVLTLVDMDRSAGEGRDRILSTPSPLPLAFTQTSDFCRAKCCLDNSNCISVPLVFWDTFLNLFGLTFYLGNTMK